MKHSVPKLEVKSILGLHHFPLSVYLFFNLAILNLFETVRWVYAPRFFVSLQQKFGVMDIKATSAGHSSRVLDRLCYSSQVSNGPCFSS